MYRTIPHTTRRRGVTLIEVVIAIFVLSVGILGILALFPTGYRLARTSVERSIAALASRHALARVYGRINNIKAPDTSLEPLYAVPDGKRTGTVLTVAPSRLTCRVLGGQSPAWPTNLGADPARYYLVMTSGAADGHIYPITGNGTDYIDTTACFDKAQAQAGDKLYEPVRVGDHFAIIGMKDPAATKCYPHYFLGGTLPEVSDPANGADPEQNQTRTMPIATYGDTSQHKDLWRYSYGCILTCPPPEFRDMCRLDVLIYSGFPYRAESAKYPDPSVANSVVIGHYVTYIAAGRKLIVGP